MNKIYFDVANAYVSSISNSCCTVRKRKFESDLEIELTQLIHEISDYSYQPGEVVAYIVGQEQKKEVFAVHFRDRIVQYLLYDYINPVLQKFIHEKSSSGQLHGHSVENNNTIYYLLKNCSRNFVHDCYLLDFRIQSYHMNINREQLYGKIKVFEPLMPYRTGIINFLLRQLIFFNPVKSCKRRLFSEAAASSIPKNESMFYAKDGFGILSEGPVASLFGDIYLSDFDSWVLKHFWVQGYYRTGSHIIISHSAKDELEKIGLQVEDYLRQKFDLTIHADKSNFYSFSKNGQFQEKIWKYKNFKEKIFFPEV